MNNNKNILVLFILLYLYIHIILLFLMGLLIIIKQDLIHCRYYQLTRYSKKKIIDIILLFHIINFKFARPMINGNLLFIPVRRKRKIVIFTFASILCIWNLSTNQLKGAFICSCIGIKEIERLSNNIVICLIKILFGLSIY